MLFQTFVTYRVFVRLARIDVLSATSPKSNQLVFVIFMKSLGSMTSLVAT